jgi:hypothetical protein
VSNGDHIPRTTATATIAATSQADHDAGDYGKRDASDKRAMARSL